MIWLLLATLPEAKSRVPLSTETNLVGSIVTAPVTVPPPLSSTSTVTEPSLPTVTPEPMIKPLSQGSDIGRGIDNEFFGTAQHRDRERRIQYGQALRGIDLQRGIGNIDLVEAIFGDIGDFYRQQAFDRDGCIGDGYGARSYPFGGANPWTRGVKARRTQRIFRVDGSGGLRSIGPNRRAPYRRAGYLRDAATTGSGPERSVIGGGGVGCGRVGISSRSAVVKSHITLFPSLSLPHGREC